MDLADKLTYRFARPDELADISRLIAHSFPRLNRPPDWWVSQLQEPVWGGGADTLLVGYDDGQPVAALQLHPLQQWVGGELLATAGVGTVTISPTHRKRGHGAKLVTAGLRAAHERGDIASALYPFRSSFYRQLGYGHAGDAIQYQVPPDWLPDSPERLKVVRLESDDERAEALDCYNRWAATQNGQLARSDRVWRHVLETPERALFGFRNSGSLEGYALINYRVDLPRRDRFLEVDELAWLTLPAARGLYGWLHSLNDQWQQILVRALPSHHFGTWLREVRLPHGSAPLWGLWEPAATLMSGPMFRLVDARAAFERRHTVPGTELSVDFEVVDEQLPQNSGTLRLTLEDERAHTDRHGGADLSVRLDISTLSRLYIGTLPPVAGYEAGLLECDRPDLLPRLGAALAMPEPWTFDRF